MFRTFKRLTVVSAVAAIVIGLFPVASGAAIAAAPCQAKDLVKLEEWAHTVLVNGQYAAAGAVDVQLTCGIVQNGVTMARISESVPGPVAAIAATQRVQGQFYSVCYELFVTFVDDNTSADTCP